MIYTPESQHEEDVALRRRLHTIWLHEQDGEQQINIARRWGISQSRAWQIYHSGKKCQKIGLI